MIEIVHRPDVLPARRAFECTNALRAYNHLQQTMEFKRPRGLRVRYGHEKGVMYMSARDHIALGCAVGIIKSFIKKEIPYQLTPME